MTERAAQNKPAKSAPGVFSPRIRQFAPLIADPAISVVMSTWNNPRHMREAVDAVLAQTFENFEFVIIDDASDYAAEVKALEKLDPRIRTQRLAANVGGAEAANCGIALAKAPLIARMDYDDHAEPGWLEATMAAFNEDPELGLVGTWVSLITEHGDPIGIDRTPESDFAIRFTLLSHNPFYNTSTVYRRELIELVGGIEAGQNASYDHRLWRAVLPHCRARNLPSPLVRYRYSPGGVTGSVDQAAKRLNTRHIRVGLWQELGLEYPIESSQLGDAVDDFLRDRPCRQPELWSEVAAVIELALAATATKTDDFLRQGDRSNRDAFAVKLQNRLAQGPRRPPGSLRRLARALRTRGLKRTLRAAMRLLPVTKSVPKT